MKTHKKADFPVADVRRFLELEPIDEWPSSFRACLGAWPDEIERPAQEPVTGIEDPFE
ncbi:hypothetical protein ACSRUE_09565 [Sorangium sp. KYC3313]|uniref:hypothetical protein n=1 Tax=Sorangium sp. KYC3313 TaxID=3449740 RepID=UPI003F88D71E